MPRIAVPALVAGCFVAVVAFRGASAAEPAATVVNACHVSPIVDNLDRAAAFYHDLLGLDLVPGPPPGPLPVDTDPGHLLLHGLPQARLRFIGARMPGVRCGVEIVELTNVDRAAIRRRYQDPGSVALILTVRDLDAVFARLKAAGAHVVTTGGAPVFLAGDKDNKTRAVTVQDPDGHYVQLVQPDPAPVSAVAAASNVVRIGLRLTVADLDQTVAYYSGIFGIVGAAHPFAADWTLMTLAGLPVSAESRLASAPVPGSALVLEFVQFRGLDGTKVAAPSRVQDPGSYRLQLTVRDIDVALSALKAAGSPAISSGGVPVSMTFGSRPWRLAVVRGLDNLFLIVQQAPS